MAKYEVLPPFTGVEILENRLSELKLALRIVKNRQNPQLSGKLYIYKSHGTDQFRLMNQVATANQAPAPANQVTTADKIAAPANQVSAPANQPAHINEISSAATLTYIPKVQTNLLHQYCQKEYDEKLIPVLEKQIAKIEKLLTAAKENPSIMILENFPTAKRVYITPVTLPPSEYLATWQSVYYRKKGFYPNAPQFITANGDRVRSKSETILADTLARLNIPYRYEFPVKMNAHGKIITFHPDFYCLNLRTRQEFIWEHFGLLDETDYAENVAHKIEIFHENGYFEGVNLLYTIETENTPLTTKHIEQIVRKFLL